MACFVTGIVPTNDIAELEKILGTIPSLDRAKLQVITKAERSDEHDSSFLNFIHAGGPRIDGDTIGGIASGGTSIMTGGGGTGVPGMGSHQGIGAIGGDWQIQTVGNLPIPGDEADNYNDAIANGRTVVAYECTDTDSAALEEAMRNAGVRKVKTFKG